MYLYGKIFPLVLKDKNTHNPRLFFKNLGVLLDSLPFPRTHSHLHLCETPRSTCAYVCSGQWAMLLLHVPAAPPSPSVRRKIDRSDEEEEKRMSAQLERLK